MMLKRWHQFDSFGLYGSKRGGGHRDRSIHIERENDPKISR